MIDEFLNELSKSNPALVTQLSLFFNTKAGIEGKLINEDHSVMKKMYRKFLNQKTASQDFNCVMACLKDGKPSFSSDLEVNDLNQAHEVYTKNYNELIQLYIARCVDSAAPLKELAKEVVTQYKNNKIQKEFKWTDDIKKNLPVLLAKIAALWTVKSSRYAFEGQKSWNLAENFEELMRPSRTVGCSI